MEGRSADDEMPPLVAAKRVAPANGGLNCFGRHTERLVRIKPPITFALPVCITKFQRESEHAIAEIQKIGCETFGEVLRAFGHNSFAPYHSARQPPREQP